MAGKVHEASSGVYHLGHPNLTAGNVWSISENLVSRQSGFALVLPEDIDDRCWVGRWLQPLNIESCLLYTSDAADE